MVAVAAVVIVALSVVALAAFLLYRYSSRADRSSRHSVSPNMKITRLTVNGKPRMPDFTDGKTVVYILKEGAQKSLWIRQVATNSNIQIVAPAEANIGRNLLWTATSSTTKAYDKDTPQGALFQVPAFGGVPRKILSNIASPIALSPDGSRFAFIRNDNAATGEDQLIVANADQFRRKQNWLRARETLSFVGRVELVA